MNYPLHLTFRIFALAPRIDVEDAAGHTLCHVKQRLFRLREKVEVYTDATHAKLLCHIAADRIIDFNAGYAITDAAGTPLGRVRRRGMRSLWSARYELLDAAGSGDYVIEEENPFTKFMDALLGDIPLVGLFTGYFLNPRYTVKRGGEVVWRVSKRRAFLQHRFTIEQAAPAPGDELRLLLSLIMFVLLERMRG